MSIPSETKKTSRTNRLKVRVLSIFLVTAIVLSFGMSAFAISGSNEGDDTGTFAEVTDILDETTDTPDETTDILDEAADTVDETTDTIDETTDTVVTSTDTLEETTDAVVTPTDTLEETTDTVVTPTDTLDEVTDSTEEIPEEFPLAAVSETDVCSVGDKGYESIEAAVADNTGGTITMLKNVDYNVNCAVTIPSGKSFTLDLSGKTISSTAPNASVSWVITIEGGSLTIKDSVGGGKITMHALVPDPTYGYASNTIRNRGSLTVNSGTIDNTTNGDVAYGIDHSINGQNTMLTINGGVVKAVQSEGLRLHYNYTTASCDAVINGGTISSGGYGAIWIQNPTSSSAVRGSLTINGGTFNSAPSCSDVITSRISSAAGGVNMKVTINGGTFNGDVEINSNMPIANVAITGGNFKGKYGAYSNATDYAGFISGGHFTGANAFVKDAGNHACAADYIKDGYAAIFDKEGTRYAESELSSCADLPYDVYKLTEVTVTPDAKMKYTDETSDPELTYTIDETAAKDFITVELERAAGTAAGDYLITAKTLKGGLDTTTNPDEPMYYLPVLSASEVKLTIKDGGYIKHTESNDTTEGSVEAESYARSDVELVVEHTAPAAEQKIEDALTDKEEMLFTQEVHFERDGDHVTVGEVCRDGKVNITFNVGEKYNGLSVVVYHVVSATRTDRDVKIVENGKVSYTAYSLSPFGIALLKDTLTVTNAVKGKEASKDDEFTYEIKLAFPDTFSYDIMDKSGTVLSSGTISDGDTFTLKGDQKIVIKDLPVGMEYEIDETAPDGYTISFKNNKGKVAASGSTAAFTNTKGSSSGGSPKTGDESTSLAVQICTVLINLSLLGLMYAIFFDKSKVLTKLFGKKAEGKQNEGK